MRNRPWEGLELTVGKLVEGDLVDRGKVNRGKVGRDRGRVSRGRVNRGRANRGKVMRGNVDFLRLTVVGKLNSGGSLRRPLARRESPDPIFRRDTISWLALPVPGTIFDVACTARSPRPRFSCGSHLLAPTIRLYYSFRC